MAGIAGKFANRLLADVLEELLVASGRVRSEADEHHLITTNVGQSLRQAAASIVGRFLLGEAAFQIERGEFFRGRTLIGGQRICRGNVRGLPVLGGLHQPSGGIRSRIADGAVGMGDGLQQDIRHQCLGVVFGGFTQPTVEPSLAIGMRGEFRSDPGEIRPLVVAGSREGFVLVTGQTATHLNHFLTTVHVRLSSDALVRLDILKRSTDRIEVGDDRADFDRLVTLALR